MALKTRYKPDLNFSSASMSDLVFLLLIFFILLSTMVSPNAIKLLLPNSNSKTMAKQNFTIYINAQYQYFVEQTLVDAPGLESAINRLAASNPEATIVLRIDRTVPVQYLVRVMDAVNTVNEQTGYKLKTILATAPNE
ncbi:MAG: biopolymer transporter ExbD [Bacteroidetes bacterium]|uniref:Biopolymer transporter ExbD n=1 Tax=Candidatus Pullibacteroides excrementavium TaxID=2840905 RepID=A0A9D9H3P5_9BACT|nr:biopolymer transporter ExbD [Candidatus Pullibacteroides excrementavium]